MTLAAGSVTVAEDGTATGDGMSKTIYDAIVATSLMAAVLNNTTIDPDTGERQISDEAKLGMKRGNAELASAIGSAVVSYLVANTAVSGNAHVTSESLGRTPNPNTASTAILAPAAPVDVPLSGGIS